MYPRFIIDVRSYDLTHFVVHLFIPAIRHQRSDPTNNIEGAESCGKRLCEETSSLTTERHQHVTRKGVELLISPLDNLLASSTFDYNMGI